MMLASTLGIFLGLLPHDDVPVGELLRHLKHAPAEMDALHEVTVPPDSAVLGHALAMAGDHDSAIEAFQRGIEPAAVK
jgi:hypothetical protein